MQNHHDVVIVGARCAGATLATFLARAGAKVLLLEKDTCPSDMVLSTHSIHPAGMEVLDEVGVGPAVREKSPASRILRIDTDGVVADLELPGDLAVYCPRRERLDGLLQGAAVGAGAELLDRTRVTSLLWENGRVRGVRAVSGGRERTFTGGLVVGADGRRSTVARLVEAEEYLAYDGPRAAYWGYWNAPDIWTTDPAYRFDMYFCHIDEDPRVIFQTDDQQLLIGSWPMRARLPEWRNGSPPAALVADPVIGPLIRESKPLGRMRGVTRERFFFRRGVGPGWALVGDAGHHKDFVLGDGIAEALLQARSLAAAMSGGKDRSLVRWWRARDVEALPFYFLGKEAAASERPLQIQRVLASILEANPDLGARVAMAIAERDLARVLSGIPASTLLWRLMREVLAGRTRAIGELLEAAWKGTAIMRELRLRRKLLAEAQESEERGQDQALTCQEASSSSGRG